MSRPERWLRGPVPDIPTLLQPVAHAVLQALDDVEVATAALPQSELWRSMGGAATVGFHLKHLAGATDRLFTYARGEPLSEVQRAWLAGEAGVGPATATAASLVAEVRRVVERCLAQLAETPIEQLPTQRLIGRAQLPTTELGCLFHAGEHAARHAGQVTTTVKLLGS